MAAPTSAQQLQHRVACFASAAAAADEQIRSTSDEPTTAHGAWEEYVSRVTRVAAFLSSARQTSHNGRLPASRGGSRHTAPLEGAGTARWPAGRVRMGRIAGIPHGRTRPRDAHTASGPPGRERGAHAPPARENLLAVSHSPSAHCCPAAWPQRGQL